MTRATISLLCGIFLLASASEGYAVIHIDGTPEQRTKIANWLTMSLGTTVGIDAAGNLTITAAGGNAAATRLRGMIGDPLTVTLKIVVDTGITKGKWIRLDPNEDKSTTTGVQEIDIADIENIGNVLDSYGETPDRVLIHEITEVFEGKIGSLSYEDAHIIAIVAEKELMSAHGTSWVFRPDDKRVGPWAYGKIKRPDGSFVVIKILVGGIPSKTQWFREQVPCTFEIDKLIAIPDPDPQVHILNYSYDLNHTFSTPRDTVNSHPTGAAFDAGLNLLVTENHPSGADEIRIFSPSGAQVATWTHPSLLDPEGIEVDHTSGDVFVAARDAVLRFSSAGTLLGSYTTGNPSFRPTDVSVWRDLSTGELIGSEAIYDIFVTDRATSQVYRFSVQNDMNAGTFVNAFGGGLLNAPEGVQVDDWWTVWVASTGNNRIYRFTPHGNLEPFAGHSFFIEDSTKRFTDMAKIRDEGLYVVDGTAGHGGLYLYDFNGNPVRSYGVGVLQCPTSLAAVFSTNEATLIPLPDPGGGGASAPTLTEWGRIAFSIFLLAAGAFLIRRRRVHRNSM